MDGAGAGAGLINVSNGLEMFCVRMVEERVPHSYLSSHSFRSFDSPIS